MPGTETELLDGRLESRPGADFELKTRPKNNIKTTVTVFILAPDGSLAASSAALRESWKLRKDLHLRVGIDRFRSIFIRHQLRLQENILVWVFDLVQRLFLFVSQIPCIANYVVSFT